MLSHLLVWIFYFVVTIFMLDTLQALTPLSLIGAGILSVYLKKAHEGL